MISGLKRAGVSIVCYLPDSLFKELYPALDADPDIRTIRVTNEGEGAAICGGVFLSGKRAALVMENSGLRAAVEHLARLGLGAGHPGHHADELPRRARREQLVGDPARHHDGAAARSAAHARTGSSARRSRSSSAIADAFDWSYAAYHHSAVVLGGELVR